MIVTAIIVGYIICMFITLTAMRCSLGDPNEYDVAMYVMSTVFWPLTLIVFVAWFLGQTLFDLSTLAVKKFCPNRKE